MKHSKPSVGLNPDFTFGRLVEGAGNRTPLAVARTVAERADACFNPLSIYGSPGTGKTHLLHAIGNAMLANDPEARVLVISGESFVSEMIAEMRASGIGEFRDRFQRLDVLLVDGIEYLAGKEFSTQEMVAIARGMVAGRKQLVVISERQSAVFHGLGKELAGVLSGGLSVCIEPPDLETRLRILDQQAQLLGVNLSVRVAMQIVEAVTGTARDLESALRHVIAFANFEGIPLTADVARRALDAWLDEDASRRAHNLDR